MKNIGNSSLSIFIFFRSPRTSTSETSDSTRSLQACEGNKYEQTGLVVPRQLRNIRTPSGISEILEIPLCKYVWKVHFRRGTRNVSLSCDLQTPTRLRKSSRLAALVFFFDFSASALDLFFSGNTLFHSFRTAASPIAMRFFSELH